MSTRSRLPILLAGVVVIVLAFVFLRPDDEEKQAGAQATAPAQTTDTAPQTKTAKTPAAKPAAKPAVRQVRIEIVDGQPIDGVTKVRVTKGETVALNVASDVSDEIHLHGYDVSRDVAPNKPARLKFKANIEGIFEVELENRGIEIASLRVDP